MNLKSHFSALVVAGLVFSCTKREASMLSVQPDKYASEECWTDDKGTMQAFLVLAQDKQITVPYLISARCYVEGYSSYGESVLHQLNAVRVVDSYGSLKKALGSASIHDNIRSDQIIPSSESKVYYIESTIVEEDIGSHRTVSPDKIDVLYSTGIDFAKFLSSSTESRERMVLQYRGAAGGNAAD